MSDSKKSTDDEMTAASSEADGEDNDASLSDMKKMLMDTSISDGSGKKKSYWAVSMETMGMAHGKDDANDLMLETIEQGVIMLKQYIMEKDKQLTEENEKRKEALAASGTGSKKKKKGDGEGEKPYPFSSWMDLVPLEEFGVSQSFFLKTFLKWTLKEKEDVAAASSKELGATGDEPRLIYNASKARRRLDSYFDWMKDNMASDLAERPLTLDSVRSTAKAWDMQCTVCGKHWDDRCVWWMDIAKMEQSDIKEIDAQEHLRYVVWFSHLLMFDKNAQDHGVVLMEDLNKIGFWNCMTLIPMDVGAKMDRLTIGVLPVKMKAIYMFGAARWTHLMIGLMKPFLSKKMRERLIIVTETMAPDRQKFVEEMVTRESIPNGFMGLEGGAEHDAMFDRLIKKKKKQAKKKAKEEKEAAK